MNTKFNFNAEVLRNFINSGAVHFFDTQLNANKTFEDTELHQALVVNGDSKGYTFDMNDDRPERMVKTFFAAVSSYLSKQKVAKADVATALVVQDVSNQFKFAGIVEYNPNVENPDEAGNWSYVMTFYESDITDLEKTKTVNKLLIGDDAFKSTMDKAAYDIGGFCFEREIFIFDCCLLVVDSILQVLDHEATEDPTTIEMPGFITCVAAVEKGEKVFSITPSGHLKQMIKSDIELGD